MNIITNYIQYSHVDIHQDHKILIDFFPACGPSHTASDHQENGSEHEGADPQGFWVEAFDHQGAQRGGVAQDDDQGHGSSLQGKDGGQEHSWYPKKTLVDLSRIPLYHLYPLIFFYHVKSSMLIIIISFFETQCLNACLD